MAQAYSHTPFEIDARDADFCLAMRSWSSRTQRDMQELLAAGQATIATSRVLIAQADRLLVSLRGTDRF